MASGSSEQRKGTPRHPDAWGSHKVCGHGSINTPPQGRCSTPLPPPCSHRSRRTRTASQLTTPRPRLPLLPAVAGAAGVPTGWSWCGSGRQPPTPGCRALPRSLVRTDRLAGAVAARRGRRWRPGAMAEPLGSKRGITCRPLRHGTHGCRTTEASSPRQHAAHAAGQPRRAGRAAERW